jgi:stage V sporulation protein B
LIISVLNIVFIKVRVKDKPKLSTVFIKPFFCATAMAGVVYGVYELLYRIGSSLLGTGRSAVIIYLGLTVIIGIVVYGMLIIFTRTVTREDMKLVPKGEKIARVLRIKE